MNALEIYKYIEEKGFSHSHVYKLDDERDLYTIRVYRDFPKENRFAQYYYGDSLINLFYAIQSEL